MTEIILASQSPRRQALLEQIGLSFRVDAPNINESEFGGCPPNEYVRALSFEKAKVVAERNTAGMPIIIAADTVVAIGTRMFEKPRSKQEAFRMLLRLSGKSHDVYTGVTVRQGDKILTHACVTRVIFRRLNPQEIKDYIETGEPFDKAGGYGIQGMGALLVEKIDGDFYNVMGLPLNRLHLMLREFGINCMNQNEDGKM